MRRNSCATNLGDYDVMGEERSCRGPGDCQLLVTSSSGLVLAALQLLLSSESLRALLKNQRIARASLLFFCQAFFVLASPDWSSSARVTRLRAIDFYHQHRPHISSSNTLSSSFPIVKMSGASVAPYVLKRPWLKKWMMPLAKWYANTSGYRSLGE